MQYIHITTIYYSYKESRVLLAFFASTKFYSLHVAF